ncbi:HAD family hydrolase [Natronoglycomyces albus]|uniref:HAD family phosphatase n=1 Tax=Natronoglycomyces albus TaxID=2811108 RepID=A0A895XRM7_9ACTN|nr:HAD family hydrolase [Natronoglycomyces albus]QSB05216.1 HAD family phosphatase [Natronoglycomyces albus]
MTISPDVSSHESATRPANKANRAPFVPKLVAIDLDGTVVDHADAHVRPRKPVVDALARVRDAGVPVVVVTGRAPWSALRTVEELGLTDGFVSASHGANEYDLAAGEFTQRLTVDPAPAITRFREADETVEFAAEWGMDGYWHTPGLRRNFTATFAGEIHWEELATKPTTRFVAQVESSTPYGAGHVCPNAKRLADAAALDPAHYHVEVGFNGWIDVGPPSVNKASGLARIAQHYGVDATEVVAFGDAANDLTMFEWAGHAVAMGQATKIVKAAANEVAPPVGENGVATVLRRWFP